MFRIAPRKVIRVWRRLDFPLLLLSAILTMVGVVFIYGAGQQIGGRFAGLWQRQLLFLVLGIAVFAGLVAVDYRRLARWSWLVYAISCLSLLYVLFFGVVINYSSRWLDLPLGPVHLRLQPAELAKPIAILFLAWLASRPSMNFSRLPPLLLYGAVMLPPIFLVVLQPDLGTAMVFVWVGVCIVFIAGISWRWIACAAVLAAVALPLVFFTLLQDYQRDRLQTLVNPSRDISAAGWNAHQALLAVGSGGAFGKGYMRGTQHVLGYLPQTVAPTDFIFSVIGEETGFVGAGAIVCAFIGLMICCLRAAARAPDPCGRFICVGVAAMLFIHAYVNIGMSIYMAPIVGLPLPFLSYGGSFALAIFAALGLVQSVYVRRDTPPPPESSSTRV